MIVTKEGIAVPSQDTHMKVWVERTGEIDCGMNVYEGFGRLFKEGDWVVDVGAAIGDHAVPYAKKVGPQGKVFSFEPQPELFECLKHNTKDYPQVTALNIALSDWPGKAWLNKLPNLGASFIESPPKSEGSWVRCRTLDSLRLSRVDFIKIDVEGFEMKVLRGAMQTIMKFRPLMIVEIGEQSVRYGENETGYTEFFKEIKYKPNVEVEMRPGHQPDILLSPQ